jgi:hypothetical protein
MAYGKKTGGRQAGTPNKVTAETKMALKALVDGNADNLQKWLLEIDDPAKRIDAFIKFLEFVQPKLARTELAGDPDAPIGIQEVVRRIVRPGD